MRFFSSLSLKNRTSEKELAEAITNIFGYRPKNTSVYKLAFCHKSKAASNNSGFRHSNERLEYLGDAVLGAVVADFLFKKFPYKEEGFLTEMRSRIVSRQNLNMLSHKLGLDKLVQVNAENGTTGTSIMGDAFEAFIGAVYVDKGYEFTKDLIIQQVIQTHLDIDELMHHEINFKSKIIEWSQKEKKNLDFLIVKEEDKGKKGRLYTVELQVDKKTIGRGQDFSIKKAEQRAARQGCEKLMPAANREAESR